MRSRRLPTGIVAAFLIGGALLRSSPADMVVELGEAIATGNGFRADAGRPERVAYQPGVELQSATIVEEGRLTGPVAPEAAEIWAEVQVVFPPEQLLLVSQFALIADGPGGNLAMVHRSERRADGWILSVDPGDARTQALRRTLVHELAHVITLGRDDVDIDPAVDPASCDGVATDIGCARAGSVLADFHDTFWAAGTGAGADHVTPYATTSSAEDLAETFAAVVLELPVGDGPVVEAKRAWVAEHAELGPLVRQLQARLSSAG